MVGINHVALEVDDLERALGFYRSVFSFELRGTAPGMAFLDMGDQFLALSEGRSQGADSDRHFGLVVDDLDATRNALVRTGAEILPSRGLDFRDDSGNHIQVVAYSAILFTKAPSVIRGMGAGELEKDESALAELREAGLG
jgi:catechol 2,3-dioxygenase-like lactoylglutathione lyase family enzyme